MRPLLFSPPFVFVLWIGAAVSGWYGFWLWMLVPAAAAVLSEAHSYRRHVAFAGQRPPHGAAAAVHGGRVLRRVVDSPIFFGAGYGIAALF